MKSIKVISKVKVFQKKAKLQCQGHKVKPVGTHRKVLSLGKTHLKYQSSSTHCSKVTSKDNVFKTKVKDTGSKCWHPRKGLITRNTHVQYESSSTHCSKFISKVYKFRFWGHENLISK